VLTTHGGEVGIGMLEELVDELLDMKLLYGEVVDELMDKLLGNELVDKLVEVETISDEYTVVEDEVAAELAEDILVVQFPRRG
jgi:hypothetical protein